MKLVEKIPHIDQGRRLAVARAAQGLTQRELAARSRVHQSIISRFEAGDFRLLSEADRYRICEVLEVRFNDIFDEQDGSKYEV